jgi:hypothetical protein
MWILFGPDHMHVDFTSQPRLPPSQPSSIPNQQNHAPNLDSDLDDRTRNDAPADSASLQRFRGTDSARIGGQECEECNEENRDTAGEYCVPSPASQPLNYQYLQMQVLPNRHAGSASGVSSGVVPLPVPSGVELGDASDGPRFYRATIANYAEV